MKKIINGKLYNTETASWIGNYENTCSGFRHYSEDLYQKKNGEFFLCGEGGAETKYRVQVDYSCWRDGEKIIPLSEEEAKDWVESNLDVDKYIDLFGEPEE